MQRMLTEYNFFANETQKQYVKGMIDKLSFLLPSWLRYLSVESYEEDEDTRASVTFMPEYRSARLALYALWFTESEETQLRMLIHEFVHLRQAEMLAYIKDTFLCPMKDDKRLYDIVTNEWRRRTEEFTEDMAHELAELIGDRK